MPRNIEIKARVKDVAAVRERIERVAGKAFDIINQVDTYFAVQLGRLKLRQINDQEFQLIYYLRKDSSDPRPSDYKIADVSDGDSLRNILVSALGRRGIVKKKRMLYTIGETRVHLDEVDDLGTFLELEIPVTETTDEETGRARAREIMSDLGINGEDLLDLSYIDLLLIMSRVGSSMYGARLIPFYHELKMLRLPIDQYALFGSSLLAVYKIRPAWDLDIIVKKDLWDNLERTYSNCLKQQPDRIQINNIEIFKDWPPFTDNIDEMIDTSDMIENVPFVRLEYVVRWKRWMGRPKDLKDIKLIENFIKRS